MSDTNQDDRRHFRRIPISLDATLLHGDTRHPCRIIDVSLHGVLLARSDAMAAGTGDKVKVDILIDQLGEAAIHMQGEVAHVSGERLGIKCHQLDLESASQLRRLVELNLADPDLLERELAAMIDAA